MTSERHRVYSAPMVHEDIVEGRGVTWRTREQMRECGVCARQTKHRVTTIITGGGDVTGEVERCLEHDED